MANIPVPSIATVTAESDDTVLGSKDGAVRRFPLSSMPVGFTQTGSGAVARTVQDKAGEVVSVKDFGAEEGRSGVAAASNLSDINSAIASSDSELFVPQGDWVVSALPTNPVAVNYVGPGRVLKQDADGGYQQINTYADRDICIGRETLTRVYARLALGPSGGFSKLKVFCYGDSTVEGYVAPPATRNGYFLPQTMLPRILKQQGIHNVSVTNRGVSGESWPNLNALGDLSADTDLFIIKYGINDRALAPTGTPEEKLLQMAQNMDAKLSAIRSAAYGNVEQLSIILVGPNATKDQTNGRNEEWYESVRRVYVYMARKHGCCYFDTYSYLRDARLSGQFWLDSSTAGSETIRVHPLDAANQWIWAGVVRHAFPKEEHGFWAANNFTVIGEQGGTPLSSTAPNVYGDIGQFGETWELAAASNGFPANGFLKTSIQPDGYTIQELYPLSAVGRTYVRYCASGSTWGSFWTGASVSLTLSNSWVVSTAPDTAAYAVRSEDGTVIMGGSIKNGTTTTNTLIATLPANYRPATYEYAYCASTTATPVLVRIDPDGSVYLLSTGDATRTSFTGVQFKAA